MTISAEKEEITIPKTGRPSPALGVGKHPNSQFPLPETEPLSYKTESHLGHLPWLDGMRGIACALVVLFHLFRPHDFFTGGFIGVDIFFVISGFLITSLLVREKEKTGGLNLANFYVRRALRLLPAFLAMLVACWAFVFWFAPREEYREVRTLAILASLYQSNQHDIVGEVHFGFFGHTWSLSVEEQFYLFWPLILGTLLSQKAPRRWTLFFVLLGIVACMAIRARLYFNKVHFARYHLGLDARGGALLIGCLTALLVTWKWLPQSRRFQTALKTASLICLLGMAYVIGKKTQFSSSIYYCGLTAISLATGVLIVTMIQAPPRLLSQALEFPALTGLGKISYGLYLWHWPILIAFTNDHSTTLSEKNVLGWSTGHIRLAVLASSFIAALVSFYCIERPFLRMKARLS